MDDGVFAAGSFAADDAAGAGDGVFRVLDAVADARGIRSKLGVADDDFEVVSLVKALELFGVGGENQGADGQAGVGATDGAGRGVVGRGDVGLEVGHVLTPVRQ